MASLMRWVSCSTTERVSPGLVEAGAGVPAAATRTGSGVRTAAAGAVGAGARFVGAGVATVVGAGEVVTVGAGALAAGRAAIAVSISPFRRRIVGSAGAI